jgi:hypothetical protein
MLQPFRNTRKWTMQTLSNLKFTVMFMSYEGADSYLCTECMGVALTNFRKQVILTIIKVNEIYKYLLPIGANTEQTWRPCYTPVVTKPLSSRRRHCDWKYNKTAKLNGRAV